VKLELLVPVEDPGEVDRNFELGEDLLLHTPSGDGKERQRSDRCGVAGISSVGLAVVRRMVVLERGSKFADFLSADLEVVRCP